MARTSALSRADRERRLVDAALELLATRAPDDITVDEIAAHAGVAHGLLFHYFGSKRGLFLEAFRRYVAQLEDQFESNRASDPSEWLADDLRILFDNVQAGSALLRTFRTMAAETGDVGSVTGHFLALTTSRLAESVGLPTDSALVQVSLNAWAELALDVAMSWGTSGGFSRAEAEAVVAGALRGVLRSLVESHPEFTMNTPSLETL